MYDGETKADEGVNCSDGTGCGVLFLRKKNRTIPTAISRTAAEPIAIPAIAPPPILFDFVTAAADVEVCAAAEVDEVDEVEELEEDVADDAGADVDCAVELLSPPGCRSA